MASLTYFVTSRNQSYASGAAEAGCRARTSGRCPAACCTVTAALQRELRSRDVVLIKGRDTQRLERIAFVLAGRPVRCDIEFCRAMPMRGAQCGMLERGWEGLRIIFWRPVRPWIPILATPGSISRCAKQRLDRTLDSR
ncbi:MAG: hypothetical protein ACUVXB_13495 [Bryobacteraceae bacterium]